MTIDWTKLLSDNFTVKYIQFNFERVPTQETMNIDILDYLDSDSTMTLTKGHINLLAELINDTTNFSNSDCGTFYINGGLIAMKADTVKGKIEIGCGFSQWNFYPYNPNGKWGHLNSKGFEKMTKLLDEINDNHYRRGHKNTANSSYNR